MDNSEKQKNFFPDYIIGVNGEIWIVETKGGFDRSGNSQDIDLYTPKKFAVLKDYLDRYGLKGGIVRYDEKSEELCICIYIIKFRWSLEKNCVVQQGLL